LTTTRTQEDPIQHAAQRLQEAARNAQPCAPVRDLLGTDDISSAYQVQQQIIAARTATGARRIGRKIGLTNPKVQQQLRVDQPDFGILLDDMACNEDGVIDIGRLLQPKLEAELAFVLARDLDSPGTFGIDEVAKATAYVVPALEIVDSRIIDWDITITDTVADNASSGLFVLGSRRTMLGDNDLEALTMVLQREDEEVSVGRGADCLGNPLNAIAWLADTARDFGDPLRAGDIVLSGALGPMTPVLPGALYIATIGELGTVQARFGEHKESPRGARR
jgi:2-keto-4-pentenoate hydratase